MVQRGDPVTTVYLDSSAMVKLTVTETHSAALHEWLRDRPERASCAPGRTDVLRAVRATGPGAVAVARGLLGGLYLIHLDDRLLDTAGTTDPPSMRSLDASISPPRCRSVTTCQLW
jgi:hypothetical protein